MLNFKWILAACAAASVAAGAVGADEPASVSAQAETAWPEMTATSLAQSIRDRRVTAVEATRHYLARIDAHNRSGAELNAVIVVDPTALAQAERLDAMAAQGRFAGPLHGVPVLVKDTIDVAGLPTTAGSLALAGNTALRDAEIVARLRAQGAIILGKANLSEWSNFRAGGMPAGWSAVGGQTRNPYSLDHSPCGSSSGSAVAVAAGFAPLTLGAETNASLICPAAVNGVAGFRPTHGLLPQDGMVLVSESQDTAGPMARSVEDIALAMAALTSANEAAAQIPLADASLAGVRIGVFRWAEGQHPAVSAAFNEAVQRMEAAGAAMVDITEFSPDPVMWQYGEAVLVSEFADNLERTLQTAHPRLETRTIEALIAFNASVPEEEVDRFGQDILDRLANVPRSGTPEHRERVSAIRSAARERGIDHLLDRHDVAVLIMPAAPPAAPLVRDEEAQRLRRNVGASWLPAMAGYPMLTVPMGQADGLPLGLGIVGRGGEDWQVIAIGAAYERVAPPMDSPDLIPLHEGERRDGMDGARE